LAGESGGHGESPTYEIHLRQFFDHYLKGKPAPKWMTRSVPANLKGIDNRLDLDYEIKTPGLGLLINREEQTPQQKQLLKQRTYIDENGRIVNFNKSQSNKATTNKIHNRPHKKINKKQS
jgi:hypothetical protein